jgi:hypothetical protein
VSAFDTEPFYSVYLKVRCDVPLFRICRIDVLVMEIVQSCLDKGTTCAFFLSFRSGFCKSHYEQLFVIDNLLVWVIDTAEETTV